MLRVVRSDVLGEEDRRALFGWSADPFQSKASGIKWRPKDHHVVIYEDERAACHVGLVRETVVVEGVALAVGGVGNVIAVPEFQGRGLARRGLEEAARVMVEEWRLRYGLLFCFAPLKGFYEKLGWTARREAAWVEQPAGRIAMPTLSMARAWDGAEWPAGEIEIAGLPW